METKSKLPIITKETVDSMMSSLEEDLYVGLGDIETIKDRLESENPILAEFIDELGGEYSEVYNSFPLDGFLKAIGLSYLVWNLLDAQAKSDGPNEGFVNIS
jgi:hypothetical protein